MGLGVVELAVVALLGLLLIRAINRGGGAAAAIGLLLLLAIGGWVLFRARSGQMQPPHQILHAPAPVWNMQQGSLREFHMQPVPHPDARLSVIAVVIIVMAVVAALAVGRRHGLSIGGLLALGIAGVVLFMFLGTVVTHRRVQIAPPQVAMSVSGPHGEVHVDMPPEPPIDELWERLNESRIQLSSAAEEATQQAIAAAAAVAQAASAAEAEAVKQAAAEAATDGPQKAATAGRAPEESEPADPVTEEPPTEEPAADDPTAEEPAAEEPAAEETASDEPAETSAHENEDLATDEWVDEAAHDEATDAETAEEPAAEWSDDSAELTPDTAAPPVEPAQPAAEAFADPTAEHWPQEPASPAPATREAIAALPDPEPEPRPEWVGAPPKVVENIYRVPVQAGPYVTLRECYDQLRNEMRTVVQQRVEELVRESTGTPYVHIPDLDWMHIGASYIDRELLTDEYVEINDTSVGTMRTAWGLLEFTPNHDRHLVESWKRYARQDRMAMVATMAALLLGALGGVLMLLKIDTWTRGYYTKRLFLGVPAAIIAFFALIALIAEM